MKPGFTASCVWRQQYNLQSPRWAAANSLSVREKPEDEEFPAGKSLKKSLKPALRFQAAKASTSWLRLNPRSKHPDSQLSAPTARLLLCVNNQ